MHKVGCTSFQVSLTVCRYWGKRDTTLILPTNSSLSVSLEHLRSTTTAAADPSFEKDRLWLNGKEEQINGRTATCIANLKALRKQIEDKDSVPLSDMYLHIASFNNFPTAAGLASSASGFAALVASIAQLYKLPATPSQLSLIARQGSGSACRSLFGGFVAWQMGSLPSGEDSLAVQIASQSHWPDMHALICVVSDLKKATSSTSGMQRTVETSSLLQHRIDHVVPQRMKDIQDAILRKDFETFAKITMADSNQFHAVALDTEPPIFYMNDVSRAIIALIVEYNRASGKLKAAYTFDAGPNAVIYTLAENVKDIAQLVIKYFPQQEQFNDVLGIGPIQPAVIPGFNENILKQFEVGAVKGLIHTCVGDGPRSLDTEHSLLKSDGYPL